MSKAKVVHLDSHQEVQALLPWYVTQRLSGEELVRVVMHLADCPRCQADLDIERKLQAAHLQIATSGDVERLTHDESTIRLPCHTPPSRYARPSLSRSRGRSWTPPPR